MKDLCGKTHTIQVTGWDETIESFKLKVYQKTQVYPNQQRLIFGGGQLGGGQLGDDQFCLGHYGIRKESTIHLNLRLRGNGDMIKNHITKLTPQSDWNVAIDAGVSVQLDTDVRSVDPSKLFRVICNGSPVPGIAVYDPKSRMATFCANNLYPSDARITVKIQVNAL